MNAGADPLFVVCARVLHEPPIIPDSTTGQCVQCETDVWISPATTVHVERFGDSVRVVCHHCAAPLFDRPHIRAVSNALVEQYDRDFHGWRDRLHDQGVTVVNLDDEGEA